MMDKNLKIEGWEDEEYKAFVDKFKAKKTTDDCYTPANIYDAVADWVAAEYSLDKAQFVRPFWPGGDYQSFEYAAGAVVVDNPPFSILAPITRFYMAENIRFFLFAPALTLFSASHKISPAYLPIGVTITYENGAQVPTSFVTNLEPATTRVRTAPALYRAVKMADDVNRAAVSRQLPRYEYPDNIITAAMVQRWCKYGVEYRLDVADSLPISALDAQKERGLGIFGNGFLLGSSAAAERAAAERAAAERAAAERAAAERWKLSESEKLMVKYIDDHAASKKLEAEDG